MRRSLNKNIDIKKLFDAAAESFRSGWGRVKLYFMIGLPGEEDKDVFEIAALVEEISRSRMKVDGKPAQVAVSINAFIPKPHTPFAKEKMDTVESLARKRGILRDAVKSRKIELDFHSFDMSLIEAALARGDRTLSGAIYESWKAGSRFDGWQDHFSLDRWLSAFKSAGIDPAFYVTRARHPGEILPWDFIEI